MHEPVRGLHSRRNFLRLTLMGLGATSAASLLAACGPAAAPTAAPTTAPAAPAAAPTTAATAAAKPTTAPGGGAATPTAAAASIAGPTATPYPVANFGSSSAKISIRVESLQGVVDFPTKMQAAAISYLQRPKRDGGTRFCEVEERVEWASNQAARPR